MMEATKTLLQSIAKKERQKLRYQEHMSLRKTYYLLTACENSWFPIAMATLFFKELLICFQILQLLGWCQNRTVRAGGLSAGQQLWNNPCLWQQVMDSAFVPAGRFLCHRH